MSLSAGGIFSNAAIIPFIKQMDPKNAFMIMSVIIFAFAILSLSLIKEPKIERSYGD
jgi:hypothetical protein